MRHIAQVNVFPYPKADVYVADPHIVKVRNLILLPVFGPYLGRRVRAIGSDRVAGALPEADGAV